MRKIYAYMLIVLFVGGALVQLIMLGFGLHSASRAAMSINSHMAGGESLDWHLRTALVELGSMRHQLAIDAVISLAGCLAAVLLIRRQLRDQASEEMDEDATAQTNEAPVGVLPDEKSSPKKAVPDADAEKMASVFNHLLHKSQHDALTGLPNRTLALDRMKQAIERAKRSNHTFAVVFVDLNGFKKLNDNYGHAFGDKVIRKTADRLTRSIRGLDTVSRLGGDEFLLILDKIDEAKALSTVRTLSTIVCQPVMADKGPVSVGMSAGIAIYPQHGITPAQLVQAADSAMYQSKTLRGVPVFAKVASDEPAVDSKQFESTGTASLSHLTTWEGTLRGLRALGGSADESAIRPNFKDEHAMLGRGAHTPMRATAKGSPDR